EAHGAAARGRQATDARRLTRAAAARAALPLARGEADARDAFEGRVEIGVDATPQHVGDGAAAAALARGTEQGEDALPCDLLADLGAASRLGSCLGCLVLRLLGLFGLGLLGDFLLVLDLFGLG